MTTPADVGRALLEGPTEGMQHAHARTYMVLHISETRDSHTGREPAPKGTPWTARSAAFAERIGLDINKFALAFTAELGGDFDRTVALLVALRRHQSIHGREITMREIAKAWPRGVPTMASLYEAGRSGVLLSEATAEDFQS